MAYLCPVCNGMRAVATCCPQCGRALADGGRIDDYMGPYSPYRPIDDLKMTNGFPDLAGHTCVHFLYCGSCGYSAPIQIREWDM